MTRSIPAPSRRRFLLTAGAATAVAVVAKTASPQRAPDPAKDKRATRGYRASGHIDNYYRTTKV
ncbi:MAG: twin-arginine translocation signal domain-containing protein [Burkholderiales bacterium]